MNRFAEAYDKIMSELDPREKPLEPLTIEIDDSDLNFIHGVRLKFAEAGHPSKFSPKHHKILAVRYALLVAARRGLPLHKYDRSGSEVLEEGRSVAKFETELEADEWIAGNENTVHDTGTLARKKKSLPTPMVKIVEMKEGSVTLSFKRASRGLHAKETWDEITVPADLKESEDFDESAHSYGLLSYTHWEDLLEPEKKGFGGKGYNPKLELASGQRRPKVRGTGKFNPGPKTTDYLGIRNCSKKEIDNLKEFRDVVEGLATRDLKLEDELAEYASGQWGEVVRGFDGMDVYLPGLKMGFDMHETLWHLESVVGKNSHKERADFQEKKGVRLIQVYQEEWEKKKQIVESRIRCKLGKSERIFARKTKIVELGRNDTLDFLNKTHIQGSYGFTESYGLESEGRVVACMTFGRSRFSKKYDWELLRYCSELDTVVVGGADRLLKHFMKKNGPTSLISYADRRWSDGNLYKKLGFRLENVTKPGYCYYNICKKEFFNRLKIQNNKLNEMFGYEPDAKEYDVMLLNGFDRLWDAGQYVFTRTTA